jgi:Ca-activated chloride channel homolog
LAFLTPAFLLLSLLAAPIIFLYMLRLRRREVVVSSTLLWQNLLRDREANAPWQRLRPHLLLFLQLLILAALALALARPFLPVPAVAGGSAVILLDGSASMQATDVEPNRFAAAKQEVAGLIRNLGSGDRMTLILVTQAPIVLASAAGDQNHLLQALSEAEAGAAPANWPAAFAVAGGAAQGFRDARIVIVSDGGLPSDLPPLPAEVVFVPIGRSGENLAISALATRSGNVDEGPQLFAAVSNQGRSPQHALLSLYLDGRFFDSRRIHVDAGATEHFTWSLPDGAAVVEARLANMTADYLALDNVAWAVHEGGLDNEILLVSSGNLFLERALSILPGTTLFRERAPADGTAVDPGTLDRNFDLFVFDGAPVPENLPPAPLLIVNPQGENELFRLTGVFSDTQLTRLADSPLLQYVEWRDVNIRQAQGISAPWAQTIIGAAGGPLLMAGEFRGQRAAILAFDLHHSDLPLRIAFPILMANIIDWLNPGRTLEATGPLLPGDAVAIRPGATTTAVSVTKPDGAIWRVAAGNGDLLFTETDQLGLYRVTLSHAAGSRDGGAFAVNLFAPAEAAIEPAENVTVGLNPVTTAGRDAVGRQEMWPWLVLLGVAVLTAEWWVYHRGTLGLNGSRWPAARRWRQIAVSRLKYTRK